MVASPRLPFRPAALDEASLSRVADGPCAAVRSSGVLGGVRDALTHKDTDLERSAAPRVFSKARSGAFTIFGPAIA